MLASGMQMNAIFICFVLTLFYSCNGQQVVDLGQSSWLVENSNGSVKAWTKLPAYPLEVLRASGVIDNPLFRYAAQHAILVTATTVLRSHFISCRVRQLAPAVPDGDEVTIFLMNSQCCSAVVDTLLTFAFLAGTVN